MAQDKKKKNEKLVAELNRLLADYNVCYQKLRSYHWNVRGKRFFQLHEEFEKLYNETAVQADEVAERISRLGTHPASTLKQFLDLTRMKEDDGNRNADEMVRGVIDDLEALSSFGAEAIDIAEDHDDVATANMLEDFIQRQEEHAWMLGAWLNEGDVSK